MSSLQFHFMCFNSISFAQIEIPQRTRTWLNCAKSCTIHLVLVVFPSTVSIFFCVLCCRCAILFLTFCVCIIRLVPHTLFGIRSFIYFKSFRSRVFPPGCLLSNRVISYVCLLALCYVTNSQLRNYRMPIGVYEHIILSRKWTGCRVGLNILLFDQRSTYIQTSCYMQCTSTLVNK